MKDVEACSDWLDRRTYVECVHGVEYSAQRYEQVMYERLQDSAGRPVWGDPALSRIRAAHRSFDELSGVLEEDRSPEDVISRTIFDKTRARLDQLDWLVDHVNTYVAHSGNSFSRKGKALDQFNLTDAKKVLCELKRLADFTGLYFAQEVSGDLPVYLGDQFEGLDGPTIKSGDRQVLEQRWNELESEISSWRLNLQEL
jgi:hypothetical protein